ncbi:MAG: CBS domain-containing protein [Phormidium sp. GEM2.Bin31]|nr:MAG: CBS domain-containing protein [Phormidium sp. GEM2.Bin31]
MSSSYDNDNSVAPELKAAILPHPRVISPDATVSEAIATMSGLTNADPSEVDDDHQRPDSSSCVVVVVDSNQIVGIVTERDIVRLSAQDQPFAHLRVAEVMTQPVVTLKEPELTDIFNTLSFLQQRRLRHLPIVDDQERLIGLISYESLQKLTRPVDLMRLRLVGEVMARNIITAAADRPLLEIAQLLAQHRISCVVITECDGNPDAAPDAAQQRPLGIITERDIVQFQALGGSLTETRAEVVMSSPLFTVNADDSLWAAQQQMEERRIRRVVVTGDQGELVGLVTQTTLLRAFNPIELYYLAENLKQRVNRLEAEKLALLESRNQELQSQVAAQTQRIQSQAQRDRLLLAISTTIRNSLDLATILQTAVDEVRQLLTCDRVIIYQFEEDLSGLVIAESIIAGGRSVLHREANDPCVTPEWLEPYRQGRVRVVRDIYDESMTQCHQELLLSFDIRAKLMVPIVVDDRLWGLMISSQRDQPRDWQSWEIELLQALSIQVAIALKQATQHQQLQKESEQRQHAQLALADLNTQLESRVEQRSKELQAREARYRGLMEGATDAILLATPDGYLIEANAAAEDLFGYSRERFSGLLTELSPLHISQLHPPEELDRIIKTFKSIIEQKQLWVLDTRILRADGSEIPVDISGSLITVGGTHIVQGIFRDISDRAAFEEKLRSSETELRSVFEAMGDLVLIIAADRDEVRVMPTRHQMLDPQANEILNQTLKVLFQEESNYRARQTIQDALNTGKTITFEYQIDLGHRTIYFDANISPISDRRVIWVARDMTIRQQAEAEISKLSQRLKIALSSGEIGFWDWDIRQNKIIWDEQMYALYGINCSSGFPNSKSIVAYEVWANGVHPDDRQAAEALLQKAVLGEADYNTEFRVLHPDGSLHYIKASGLVVRDEAGQPISMIGVNLDITDIRQAEAALQASETQFRKQAQRERLLREINQRISQSLDLPTIFDTACQEIRTCLEASRVAIFKFNPDSDCHEGEFLAESLSDGIPSLLGVHLLEHGFGASFGENDARLYAQGRYNLAEDLDDRRADDPDIELLSQFQVRANLVMPILCQDALWGLLCIHQCDGPRSWQQSDIDLAQQVSGPLAIAIQQSNLFEQLQQELRERQQAQQDLSRRNEELIRATRLKDEFLANMSHELRTPLNAILGMTEALQEEVFGTLGDRQVQALDTVERSASHLLALINDILDVAKIESGQVELDCAPCSVAPLCQSSVTFIKQQALKKRIQLSVDLPLNLPDIVLDERRIRQVLINLLNNAVKFTPEGGQITLAVTYPKPTEVQGETQYLRFSVIDTGIGISPDNIKKLFQPFMQIDSALNRQYEGTGLGLALTKRIVDLHGGQVGLTSEVGVGSCFTLDLPYQSSVRLPTLAKSEEELTPNNVETQSTPTEAPLLLLAEDNQANISTISSYLTAKGYRIEVAHNGQEAIDKTLALSPDLILMDIQMPGMDGLEAMQRIREVPECLSTPIIALTALAMEGDRDRCLAAGANDYLSKPVRLKQLVELIQQHLTEPNNRSS